MKEGLHPRYQTATVQCSCGNSWQTRSTRPLIKTDLCSNCHPFFTGEQRIVDTAGQVERFNRRFAAARPQTVTMQAQPVTVSKGATALAELDDNA